MSDMNDDDLSLGEDNFDDKEKKTGTLGDLWRENPMVKVGVIVVAAIVVFVFINMIGKEDAPLSPSVVSSGADITAPPGTEVATPNYIEAIEEENQARLEEAEQSGGSALPTPIDPPVGRLTVPEEETEEEDPLQRWRQLQEERLQREIQKSQTLEPEPVVEDTARTEAVQALSDAMMGQMQAILDGQSAPQGVRSISVTSPEWLDEINKKEEEAQQKAIEEAEAAAAALEGRERILVPAGEIVYAQLLTEANSDSPGPVLAQIASGVLRGSRIIGDFEVQDEVLTLTFSTVVVDGVSVDMDAIALDPETTLPGLATEVDHRYLQRIALPMAAAFVEGMATAISESGLTTVTVTGETVAEESEEPSNEQEVASGIEEAGQELRDILDEMTDEVETLVRIETGTPFGLLFLEPVMEPTDETVFDSDGDQAVPLPQVPVVPTQLPIAPPAAPPTNG